MSTIAQIELDAIRTALRVGTETEQSLDAELSESLAALAAYQSHLDSWQAQLARERDELRQEREKWDQNRAAVEHSSQPTDDAEAELNSLREKCAHLEATQGELAGQLEEARARELQLKADFEAQQAALVQASTDSRAKAASPRETSGTSAVLGSIVEQFGKLRQQRAIDRQNLKKSG